MIISQKIASQVPSQYYMSLVFSVIAISYFWASPTACAQGIDRNDPNFDPFPNNNSTYYYGTFNQRNQFIENLQIEIAKLEWYINHYQMRYNLRRFNAYQLQLYQTEVNNLRMRQAQYRWTLSNALIMRARQWTDYLLADSYSNSEATSSSDKQRS